MSQGQRTNFGTLPNRQFQFSTGTSWNNGTGFQSPATSRPPISATTSTKKKSAEELFKEHRDAALQWAKRRQNVETPLSHPTTVPPVPTVVDVDNQDTDRSATTENSTYDMFQEYRDASLRWRTNQNPTDNAESSRTDTGHFADQRHPSPTRRYDTTQRPPSETTASTAPNPSTSSQQQPSQPAFNNVPLPSPITGSDAHAGPFSPKLHKASAQHTEEANTPFRAFRKAEEESRLHETVPDTLPVNTERDSEPQQSGTQTPQEQEQQPDFSNRTYIQWLMDSTGVSALKSYERTLVLVLFVASPALVYLCERLILSWIPHAPLGGTGSPTAGNDWSQLMQRVCGCFGAMTTLDVVAATVLGVALSFTFNRDTAATDAFVSRTATIVSAAAGRAITSVRGVFGRPGAVNDNTESEKSERSDSARDLKAHNTTLSGLMKMVTRILRLPLRIPLLVRFLMVILSFGVTSRVVLGKVATVVVAKTSQYLPTAAVISAVLVCLYVAFIGLRYYLQRSATRRNVVNVLASFTKTLLLQRGRAYPIVYLHEEVAETVQIYTRGGASSGLFSPLGGSKTSKYGSAWKPAAVVENSGGFLGAIRSVFGKAVSGASQASASDASTPVELSMADKVELLQQAIDLHAPRQDIMSHKQGSDSPAKGVQVTSPKASADVLRGYKLRALWADVEKAVESDRRVQKVELIMDGRKQSCWRILSGSTQAKI